MEHPELLLIFFAIAFIYASVGFGGGSSYIAILALYALPFREIRLIALACNIIVVTGGTLIFIRNRQVRWNKILPVVLFSTPLAFAGARMKISEYQFFILLGLSLLIAAILLWVKTKPRDAENQKAVPPNWARDGLLGGSIGFLSGMVGIGGGIFLSPLLNLIKWDTARHIAATASIFILVNSVAGLAGQMSNLPVEINYRLMFYLAGAVLLGGQLGSRIGATKFNTLIIRRLTAVLVFYAGTEVLSKHLPWFN